MKPIRNCVLTGLLLLSTLCSFAQQVYPDLSSVQADKSLRVGMYATTLGYWKSGDGGGGTYVISRQGVQNGGDVIKLNNGLYANLLYDGRTFNLKQWGISGDLELRYVKDIYPFLTDVDLKKINPEFDARTTAETYIIQYLINKKANNTIIVLDGKVYYINHTIHLKSFKTIRGTKGFDKDRFGSRIQLPEKKDVCTYYTNSVLMMIVPDKDMFDSGEDTLQNLQLENFSASGVMGKEGFHKKYSGNFMDQTSVISNVKFKNLCISHFSSAFYKTKEWIWSTFEELDILNMLNNGIYLPSNDKAQANCNSIRFCRFSSCGVDYDKTGKLQAITVNRPTENRGNCIVLGGSGNTVLDCDLSHSPIGLYLQSYSNGTTVIGTYCEGAAISTYYMDYDEARANLDTEIRGGYINKNVTKKKTKRDFR